MRVFILLDAASSSSVGWTSATTSRRRRRLAEPPGPWRRPERARPGDGRVFGRTGVSIAAAAALAASSASRCVVVMATVALVTGRRRSRWIRSDVTRRRVAAAAGAVTMATVARTQIHFVVDLAHKTFRRDWMRVSRFVCWHWRLTPPASSNRNHHHFHCQQRYY